MKYSLSLKKRFRDLFLTVLMVAIVAGVSHFVITNPLGGWRLLYYVEAPLIKLSTRCNEGAPQWMESIQGYATGGMAAPASQLAYISPEGDAHHCETGWKDGVFGDQGLEPTTRFRFASTTKTVTALAVLDLVRKEKLALDDRIVEVLEVGGKLKDPRVGDITIEHLLSHRAGWDRVHSQDSMFMRGVEPWCPSQPGKLADSTLAYDPGAEERYSNLGYCLLGVAIEKATGRAFRDYISDHFNFEASTLSFLDGPYRPDEVQYDTRHENFYTSDYYKHFDFKALSSVAGLSGNALDFARLLKDNVTNGSVSVWDGERAGHCVPGEIQQCYGYGVYRYRPSKDADPVYMHGGKLPGSRAVLVIEPGGGVLVWLGAGSVRPNSDALEEFYALLHRHIVPD